MEDKTKNQVNILLTALAKLGVPDAALAEVRDFVDGKQPVALQSEVTSAEKETQPPAEVGEKPAPRPERRKHK